MRTPGDVLVDLERFPLPSQALVRRFYTVVRLFILLAVYRIFF